MVLMKRDLRKYKFSKNVSMGEVRGYLTKASRIPSCGNAGDDDEGLGEQI